jgi:hypothetical protein
MPPTFVPNSAIDILLRESKSETGDLAVAPPSAVSGPADCGQPPIRVKLESLWRIPEAPNLRIIIFLWIKLRQQYAGFFGSATLNTEQHAAARAPYHIRYGPLKGDYKCCTARPRSPLRPGFP